MLVDSFYNNSLAKRLLAGWTSKNRFPHAILLSGDKGLGKKTFAKLITCACSCTGDNKPCGICPSCTKILGDIHPDIIVKSGKGTPLSFHISQIREIGEELFTKPNEADKKMFLLYDAHEMTVSAQNALLKMLEEPPGDCLFILTCESMESLLPTVLSRVVTIAMQPVSPQDTLQAVVGLCPNATPHDVERACSLFSGNIGKCIDALSSNSLFELYDLSCKIALACVQKDEASICLSMGALDKQKDKLTGCLEVMRLIFRDVVVAKAKGEVFISGCKETVEILAQRLTAAQAMDILSICRDVRFKLATNVNYTLLLTYFAISLRQAVNL